MFPPIEGPMGWFAFFSIFTTTFSVTRTHHYLWFQIFLFLFHDVIVEHDLDFLHSNISVARIKFVWNKALFLKKSFLWIFMFPIIHIAFLHLQAYNSRILWEYFLLALLLILNRHQSKNMIFFWFLTLSAFQSFTGALVSDLLVSLLRLCFHFPP